MLVSEFSKDFLNLGEAQFALGLTLAFRGEREASNAVIAFKGTYVNGAISPAEADSILKERAGLENSIRSKGCDLITGLINMLATEPVLSTKDNSGHYSKSVNVTLIDLLKNKACTGKLYSETMIMLQRYSVNELLAVYVDTEEYKQLFKHDIQKYFGLSADKIRYNDMSDGIINELRADFKRFVFSNSCNGTYSPETGTPAAFLRTAFSFYMKGDRITKILNTKGTNMDLGGDSDMSLIDYHSLNPKKDNAPFDFMDAANKINRASMLLFTHNYNDTAFLDIMSCYRDELLRKRIHDDKQSLSKYLQGCDIEFMDSASTLDCGHQNTIANKKSSRVALCKVFSPIVDKGLRQVELYDYYSRAMDVTKETDHHDGRRLFAYVDPKTGICDAKTSHKENNSEMFQIIVSGHLALRELIMYLKREDSIATVYNFPTIIFRNSDYLRRFQSLEEYVRYIHDVSPLVEEVRNDPDRHADVTDGLFSNDKIWEYLGSNNLMHDDLFKKLVSMPLSFIKNAVEDSRVISKDKEFEDKFDNLVRYLYSIQNLIDKYTDNHSLSEYYKSIEFFRDAVMNPSFEEKSPLFKYGIVLAFYQNFKTVQGIEGKPFTDENGNYLWTASNLVEELSHVSDAMDASISGNDDLLNLYNKQVACRCILISKFYSFLTGRQISKICDWKQTREFLCICELLSEFFRRLYTEGFREVQTKIRCSKNFSFLLVACMAKYKDIFSVPKIITSSDELTFLYQSGNISPMYINGLKDLDECVVCNAERDSILVQAMNRFIEAFGDDYDACSIGMQLLDHYVSPKYSADSALQKDDVVLREAAEDAAAFERGVHADTRLRNWLRGVAEFDEYGYVLIDNHRCDLYGDDTYVLSNGILVKLLPSREAYSYDTMSEKDIQRLACMIANGV